MDEYRRRHETFGRQQAPQIEPEPIPEQHHEPTPTRGLFPGFLPIGGDWLEGYFPILLVLVVVVGLYFWLGRQDGGIGGLLGGFLK